MSQVSVGLILSGKSNPASDATSSESLSNVCLYSRLLQMLLDSEKTYNELLRNFIHSKRRQTEFLK